MTPLDRQKIDRGTIFGVLLAVAGVIAGLLLDGGTLRQILQPTAALIVLGGTFGAVMVQFPSRTVKETLTQLRYAFINDNPLSRDYIQNITDYCLQVRKHGILSLDQRLDDITDPFLRKSLTFAIDGLPIRELRTIMEIDLDLYEEQEEEIPHVLESAGGFAPTFGIIGAVVGLIQVMQRMDNISEIGKGIAVAFVSTLYGIGVANLLFLPLAGKLKTRLRQRQLMREMTLEAVILILEGISARALKERMEAYLHAGEVKPSTTSLPQMAHTS
jgi:chemotaxis protein MotA